VLLGRLLSLILVVGVSFPRCLVAQRRVKPLCIIAELDGAPRSAVELSGGERTPLPVSRSWLVSWGQPKRGNARDGGSSPDNVRDGSALSDDPGPASSDEKAYERNCCLKPRKSAAGSNLTDMGRSAVRGLVSVTRREPTPKPVYRSGGEATSKYCGVGVAMLSG
jgi:hypothetical protein